MKSRIPGGLQIIKILLSSSVEAQSKDLIPVVYDDLECSRWAVEQRAFRQIFLSIEFADLHFFPSRTYGVSSRHTLFDEWCKGFAQVDHGLKRFARALVGACCHSGQS